VQEQRTRTKNKHAQRRSTDLTLKDQTKQVQETKPKNKRQETHKEHRARIKNNVESKKQVQEE
jgi:hypothetical protein